ncbi:MAG: hypothetical protein R3B99_34220 [Polyangiales bacterium]
MRRFACVWLLAACGANDPEPATTPVVGTNADYHDEWCARGADPRFVSDFACEHDSDCVICRCAPMNREEVARRGGHDTCYGETREECIVTNPLCCGGRCVGFE